MRIHKARYDYVQFSKYSSTLLVPAEPHLIHRMFWNQGPGDLWGQQSSKMGKAQRLWAGGGFWETVERADKQDSSRTPFIQTEKKTAFWNNEQKIDIDWLWLFRWKEVLIWTIAPLMYGHFLTSAGWLRDLWRLKEFTVNTAYKELLGQF